MDPSCFGREQAIAHLLLCGWEPVQNGGGEHAILRREDGLAFLAWMPHAEDQWLGKQWQTMRITPMVSNKSTIAPTPDEWESYEDEELKKLIEAWQTYERANA